MPTPALLPLRVFVLVAIAARSLVADVLELLVDVSAANIAARRASGVFDLGTVALTVDSLGAAALELIGNERSAEEAAVARAGEALLAAATLREVSAAYMHAAAYQHVLEAVAAVELAARTAPAGVVAADVAEGRWTGPRYHHHREAAAIAVDLRRDIGAAAKGPGALHGVSCRVRKTGHMALDIEVTAVPAGILVLNQARIAAEMANPHEHTGLSWQSPEGAAIEAAVNQLANAYSFRRDGVLALYVTLDFAADLRKAQRAEIEAAIRSAGAA